MLSLYEAEYTERPMFLFCHVYGMPRERHTMDYCLFCESGDEAGEDEIPWSLTGQLTVQRRDGNPYPS